MLEIYASKFRSIVTPSQKWRWRLLATNGKKIANGSEGYTEADECENMAKAVLGGAYAQVPIAHRD